jgi:hypothetical protein
VHRVVHEGLEGLLVQRLLVVNGNKRLLLQDVVEAGGPLAATQASSVAAQQDRNTGEAGRKVWAGLSYTCKDIITFKFVEVLNWRFVHS